MTTTLLLVDVQRNMLRSPTPVPAAADVGPAITGLLARARAVGAPVVHVQNTGGHGEVDEPGTHGWELLHAPRPGEVVVDKPECDAFAGTDLTTQLAPGTSLVIAGMQSEYCIRETAMSALRRGHPTILVRGAHATYDDEKPAAGIAADVERELCEAGVDVLDAAEVHLSGERR